MESPPAIISAETPEDHASLDMDLKKIAGDDLRELSTIVKTRQNIDRIFWILVTAIIGGGAKVIWDLISAAGH